jgi:hypothetical protein
LIRVDAVWMAVQPLDMRLGTEAALARVVAVFGAAHPHHAYLFANRRANRMKVLVHDGIGVWLAARSGRRLMVHVVRRQRLPFRYLLASLALGGIDIDVQALDLAAEFSQVGIERVFQ